jgi:ribosomal protein L37AE/L43A
VSAKAGEVSRETAIYRCENCHHRVVTKAGAIIADCDKCGHTSFKTGWNRSFAPPPSRAKADTAFRKAG